MDLRQIAEVLQIPAAVLATGRKGKPTLRLVKTGPVDKPKKGG
jgi:hypothetical protein